MQKIGWFNSLTHVVFFYSVLDEKMGCLRGVLEDGPCWEGEAKDFIEQLIYVYPLLCTMSATGKLTALLPTNVHNE